MRCIVRDLCDLVTEDIDHKCCEILKYLQVYEPYLSIVGQERGRTHRPQGLE